MGTLASELQLKVRVNTFTPLLIRMNAGKTSRCGGVASAFSITYNTYICKRDTFYLIHAHSPRTTCTPTAEASEATEASEAIASRPFSTAKHVVEQAVQHCKALCSRLCSTACLVMFGRPCSTVMDSPRAVTARAQVLGPKYGAHGVLLDFEFKPYSLFGNCDIFRTAELSRYH